MSAFTGMDVSGVRQLAQQMNSSAQQIRQLMQQLTAQLNNTQWVGQDQQRFSNDWSSSHCQQLTQVAASLEEASQRANQNAQEQESTSQ